MPAARFYSSTSGAMDLTGSITSADTSITISSTTGLPGTTPFALVLDPGTASEEIVDVTNVSGTTLTVTRGVDGSSAQAHSAGVGNVRHMATARDFREPQEHIGATANVHGVGAGSSVVGTDTVQTLKNKTAQASAASAVALTVKAATGQTANILEVRDSSNVARVLVDKDGGASVTPSAAITGVKVTQASSPTAPGLHILSDKALGSDDYIKLQPGQANIFEYGQADASPTTPALVTISKDGETRIRHSSGVLGASAPALTVESGTYNTGQRSDLISGKNTSGSVVFRVDGDGNVTSPTTTSLDSRVTTVETNLGSQTTFAATSTTKNAKRMHWGTLSGTTTSDGYLTVTHGAGFTPTAVVTELTSAAFHTQVDSITSTTFRVRVVTESNGTTGSFSISGYFFCGE